MAHDIWVVVPQQGILEVNHSMTWIGALMSSIANSTSIVTQRQHGHMHDSSNLPSQTKKTKKKKREY